MLGLTVESLRKSHRVSQPALIQSNSIWRCRAFLGFHSQKLLHWVNATHKRALSSKEPLTPTKQVYLFLLTHPWYLFIFTDPVESASHLVQRQPCGLLHVDHRQHLPIRAIHPCHFDSPQAFPTSIYPIQVPENSRDTRARESTPGHVYDSDQPGCPGGSHRPLIIPLVRMLEISALRLSRLWKVWLYGIQFRLQN